MPITTVHIMEGRTDEQKEAMIAAVTQALATTLDAPEETVRIIINEMPKQHFGIGGVSAKKLGR